MSSTPQVLIRDEGAVRVLVLNRPEVKNAIDMPLRVALAEAIEAADADAGVRAVVITGSEGAFCSGGDIATMRRMSESEARPRAEAAQRVVRAIWATPKPVVAAVEGPAFGAGASLAFACDRIVAAADSRFSLSFTAVGLAGDMGVFATLPARVGSVRARQIMTLPAPMTGDEAYAGGLVDAVVPAGDALDQAMSDARRLAAGPPRALAVIKQVLGHDPAILDVEIDHQVALFDSADFAEGALAFKEKRRPVFGQSD